MTARAGRLLARPASEWSAESPGARPTSRDSMLGLCPWWSGLSKRGSSSEKALKSSLRPDGDARLESLAWHSGL
eukprot:5879761-Pyramimonas_sp.AAC.1